MKIFTTVRVKHRVGRLSAVWVEPVGWEPDVSGFGEEALHERGAVWRGEDEGEVAGLAATFADLGTNDPREGETREVRLADLFWLSSGDCRNAGTVSAA